MKEYEVIQEELDTKGYSLLRFSIKSGELGPFKSLVDRIISVISGGGNFLSPCDIPDVILKDNQFKDIPGIYLIEVDHINNEVFIFKDNKWFKLNLS